MGKCNVEMTVDELFSWLLYFPVRNAVLATGGNPAVVKRVAGLTAELECRVFGKRNSDFENYLAGMFQGTLLEGREKEIVRKCIRLRHRCFLARLTLVKSSTAPPLRNGEYLDIVGDRGGCFPTVHFGFFFSAFSALAANVSIPVYITSLMKDSPSRIKRKCTRIKKETLNSLGIVPIYNRGQFVAEVMPLVADRKACYCPTFDIVSKKSKCYPFLGGKLVLSIEPSARFAMKTGIPIFPYFTLGDGVDSHRIVIEKPLDPSGEADSLGAIEERYLSILEKYVSLYPDMVDWFYWWKRLENFTPPPK
ncbi:MAG: hypothetical protein ACP5SH_04765 [Syntrophobacteraceae bacterium]